jgi:hypothetical protein
VTYLLKTRIVELEKQPLIGNGSVTRNNGVTVGSGVFCACRAESIKRRPAADLGTAVKSVGVWCEIAASLQGRDPGSRGTSTGEDTAD